MCAKYYEKQNKHNVLYCTFFGSKVLYNSFGGLIVRSLPSIGAGLLLIGETIRIWSVSYAGGETRTRNVGAKKLCSSGPYAFVRNPLYVGNMFMYVGIVFIAGAANILLMVATTLAFFTVQYSLIIALEEEKLEELFGRKYQIYKKNVPAVLISLVSDSLQLT